jgi:hypothetical protein
VSQVEELAAQLPACFADRLGIGRVVLVSLHEGLHIDRRNQPHLMAQRADLPRPMVRTGAGFHRDDALGSGSEKRQHLRPGYLLLERRRSVPSRAMRLKDVLRQIEPDDANFLHRRLSSRRGLQHHNLGTSMPSEGRLPHRRGVLTPIGVNPLK